MLTATVLSFILSYMFFWAGFSKPHPDGSPVTPLDLIRSAIRGG